LSGHDFSRAVNATKSTWALQAAEELVIDPALYQGMTLVVPQEATFDSGFSRCGIANS
jgi:hypothetical protein